MKENERGGLATPLLMETLEDRNAATSLGSFHLPVHLPALHAHTHHWSPPAHSHHWTFAWGHSGHGHGCGGHNQSPPPASPPPASPPPASPPAVTPSVSGVVYQDLNRDGVQEAGEQAQGGRVVWADANNNGVLDAGEKSTTTAADGSYKLTGLPAGTALTILSLNDNGTTSPGKDVNLQSGQQMTNVNIGLVLPPS